MTSQHTHGTADLHMAGGNLSDETGHIHYRGVAPAVHFLPAIPSQAWNPNFATGWIPLARTILQSVEHGVDVVDLDIFSPGSEAADDLLDNLLCRIATETNVVPVMAVHNYGPFPNTLQSLSQSRCAIAVGALLTSASQTVQHNSPIDPQLLSDDMATETAFYSGRGFALNGLFKPDILAPAYGYTAAGDSMTRFGGTSGATPVTAAAVALLKQAARLKGVELQFDQVKFLLQGGSDPIPLIHPRDGFGKLNLRQSWELLKSLYDPQTKKLSLDPVALKGHQHLDFNGRPSSTTINIQIDRVPTLRSINSPMPMKMWIEFAGASSETQIRWLQFRNQQDGSIADHIELDIPAHFNQSELTLYLNLPDEVWDRLSYGDHVAIVKGVRSSLYGKSRGVDFSLPVAVHKISGEPAAQLQMAPLYQNQYQIFELNAVPGEKIWLDGLTTCSQPIRSNTTQELYLLIDNEANYGTAALKMNMYNPIFFDSLPLSIIAKKSLVRIAVVRAYDNNCAGPASGFIKIQRANHKLTLTSANIYSETTQRMLDLEANLYPSSKNLSMGPIFLHMTRNVNEPFQILLPKNIYRVEAIAKDQKHPFFRLATFDDKGKSTEEISTDSFYATGLNPYQDPQHYHFPFITIMDPKQNESLVFWSDIGKANVDLSLDVDITEKIQYKLNAEENYVHIKAWIPNDFAQSLSTEFDQNWASTVIFNLQIQPQARSPHESVVPTSKTIWEQQVAVPLSI